jgi:hypothetical protein
MPKVYVLYANHQRPPQNANLPPTMYRVPAHWATRPAPPRYGLPRIAWTRCHNKIGNFSNYCYSMRAISAAWLLWATPAELAKPQWLGDFWLTGYRFWKIPTYPLLPPALADSTLANLYRLRRHYESTPLALIARCLIDTRGLLSRFHLQHITASGLPLPFSDTHWVPGALRGRKAAMHKWPLCLTAKIGTALYTYIWFTTWPRRLITIRSRLTCILKCTALSLCYSQIAN